jgi:hypothetical protein
MEAGLCIRRVEEISKSITPINKIYVWDNLLVF